MKTIAIVDFKQRLDRYSKIIQDQHKGRIQKTTESIIIMDDISYYLKPATNPEKIAVQFTGSDFNEVWFGECLTVDLYREVYENLMPVFSYYNTVVKMFCGNSLEKELKGEK